MKIVIAKKSKKAKKTLYLYSVLAFLAILTMISMILSCYLTDFGDTQAPIWFGIGLASSVIFLLITLLIFNKYKKIPNQIIYIENNILYFDDMNKYIEIVKIETVNAKNYITRTGKLSYGKLIILTDKNEKFSFNFVENVQDVKNEILKFKNQNI